MGLTRLAVGGVLSGPVVNEGLTVGVVDLYQAPFSSPNRPHTRINALREAPDGSGRLFVNDLDGPFYVIDGGQVQLYMDLSSEFPAMKTAPGISSGFVSFVFHPEFALNGLFYTVHSEYAGSTPPNLEPALSTSIQQHSVLTEWQASDPTADVFSGSSRELMRIAAPTPFHPLGEIAFKPGAQPGDAEYGLLYLAGGDYGTGTTGQPNQLQRLDTPLGTVMRIDPLGTPFQRGGTVFPYGIPPTNPFANDGDPATLGEIYAYGFRNGHRISWDTTTEAAFVSDVGQGNIEEVNLLVPGANYGWPLREGSFALDVTVDRETVFPLPGNDDTFGFHYPVAQYDHQEGLAIAGGFVYRGTAVPALRGQFVFGDIVSGRIFYADIADLFAAEDGDPATTAPLYELNLEHDKQAKSLLEIVREALGDATVGRTDLRFGVDRAGEMYITTKQDGFIRTLVGGVLQEYSDDFDRSALGPDWLVDNLGFAIQGNELTETGPKTNAPAQMRWQGGANGGDTGTPDQYAKLQIGSPLTTTPAGFIVRANAPDTQLAAHYEVHFKTGAGEWRWEYYDPMWQATLGSCAGDGTLAALDWIGVTITGAGPDTEVSLYRWDADPDAGGPPDPTVNWGPPDCVLQSAPGPFANTGQYGGIRFYGNDAADSRADFWFFGAFAPSGPAVGDALRGGLLWDRWWAVNGVAAPTGNHPLYPAAGQVQGSSTFRCKECHGWDYKGVDGAYGSGSHFTGIGGVLGSIQTSTQMFDLITGDSVPNGHGFASYGLGDQDARDLVRFLEDELIDTDAFIDPFRGFLGDAVQGQGHYASGSCSYCHGDDGTAINFGTPQDPVWVGTLAARNPQEFLHKVRFGQPATSMPSWIGIGGTDQGAADIGRYAQSSLPIGCMSDSACDDGSFCNGAESCVAGACVAGTSTCLDPAHCDEAGDVCLECVADAECSDGSFCNGAEICSAGSCAVGADPCPGVSCDEGGDLCLVGCSVDAECNDGAFCNGVERCVAGACVAGASTCLDAGHCDEAGDVCLVCIADAECDDGAFCNGAETCSAGVCAAGADPCSGGICEEGSQTCTTPGFVQYSDEFDRTSLGPNWVVDSLSFAIVGNELAETGPKTNAPAQMRWRGGVSGGDTGTPDQYGKLQIRSPLTTTPAGFIVRANAPSGPLAAHYEFHFKVSSGQWRWEYYDPLWQATLGSCTGDGTLAALDWIGFVITGSGPNTEVSLYRWDTDPDGGGSPNATANWGPPDCVLQSATGPFADTGRHGGIRFYGNDALDSRADHWFFGGLTSAQGCSVDAECDDGVFCNGAESCVAGTCEAGTPTCVDPAHCDEVGDMCLECVADAECDDGTFCNGAETCSAGVCAAGSDPCLGGLCEEATQTCTAPNFVQYSDDFDRAGLGPNWVVDRLRFEIIGNELAETSTTTNAPAQMRWQGGVSGGDTGTANQYGKLQIRSPLTTTPAGFLVRANATTGLLAAHYEFHFKVSSGEWRWEYYDPLWQATLGSCAGDGMLAALDWIGFTITGTGPGTEVALYRWDTDPDGGEPPNAAANWGPPDCVLQSATGPFADVGRHGGIRFYGNDPLDSRADNWSFGGLDEISPPDDPLLSELWGLHNEGQTGGITDADIDALEAWAVTTGSSNVVVAILDTGIDYTHPDLTSNLWTNPNEIPGNGIDDDGNGYVDDTIGWDFYNDDNNPFDDGGHGTHVAGIIGAVGNNGIGITGVNHTVRIMPLKITSAGQAGTIDAAIAAIEYAVAMGAHVMSNSWAASGAWGEPGWDQPGFAPALKAAIEAANAAGVLFVATAGNSAEDKDQLPLFPGSYDNDNIITVAATDDTDSIAVTSSFGPTTVDLAAPGVGILSTVPATCFVFGPPPGGGSCDGSGYLLASGTSMATPHVAGVAALIHARYPGISLPALKDRLLYSVDVLPDLVGITVTEGRLNAASALEFDTLAPAAIGDLAIVATTSTTATLGFTAPGDDGVAGRARVYDIRIATIPIDAGNFASATPVATPTRPLAAGSAELIDIVGLDASTPYYFAVRAIDNVGNRGAVSNSAMGTTDP